MRFLVWEGYEVRDPEPTTYEIEPTFMVANEDPINKKGTYDISVGIENIFPDSPSRGSDAATGRQSNPELGPTARGTPQRASHQYR